MSIWWHNWADETQDNIASLAKIKIKLSTIVILLASVNPSMNLPAMAVTATATSADTAIASESMTQPRLTDNTTDTQTNINAINTSKPLNTSNQVVRQQLQHIITSEDYATSKKRQHWQLKSKENSKNNEDSWLVKLLKFLFDWDTDSDNWLDISKLQLLATIIKTLLIAALVLFIVWIIHHAQKNGWLNTVLPKRYHKTSVSTQSAASQSYLGDLPSHQQLGINVQRLLAAGQISDAASLLYRGSLRWLADNHLLSVAPATTELQCIEQLHHINRQLSQNTHQAATQHYINQIIAHWIQVAYDTPYLLAHSEQLSLQLNNLADEWLSMLPLSVSASTRLKTARIKEER
ncbi:hypothetical protein [Psychrobacter sp. I-STPA10]|uniref:hypothetical protein n=1 Tax=Psychrobacter sp. I-STPA10 TaxID=2585769 RepID=UPI001E2F33AA|nr:hypothetical protein [Psychrobacter sp. I-STPA10]